jgi:hypothetical protein
MPWPSNAGGDGNDPRGSPRIPERQGRGRPRRAGRLHEDLSRIGRRTRRFCAGRSPDPSGPCVVWRGAAWRGAACRAMLRVGMPPSLACLRYPHDEETQMSVHAFLGGTVTRMAAAVMAVGIATPPQAASRMVSWPFPSVCRSSPRPCPICHPRLTPIRCRFPTSRRLRPIIRRLSITRRRPIILIPHRRCRPGARWASPSAGTMPGVE